MDDFFAAMRNQFPYPPVGAPRVLQRALGNVGDLTEPPPLPGPTPTITPPSFAAAQTQARPPVAQATAKQIDVTGQPFTSAYTDEIANAQKTVNDLEERSKQPGAMYTPEQVAARRQANERMQQLGMIGVLSGDEAMAGVGGMVLKQAMQNKQPHVTAEGVYDYATGEQTMFPGVRNAKELGAARKNLEGLQTREAQQRASWTEGRTRADERAEAARLRAADADAARTERQATMASNRNQSDDFRRYNIEDTGAARFDAETKDFAGEIKATKAIENLTRTAASTNRALNAVEQQTMAVLLQKFLDPTSVVRETEYSRAGDAAGLVDRAAQWMDKITKGEFLPPGVIGQIADMAAMYQQAAQEKINRIGDTYYSMAQRRGLNAENIVRSPWYQTPERRGQQRNSGAKPPETPRQELERRRREQGGAQ